jgi:hypothetical protein
VHEIQEVAVARCAVGRPELERVLAEAFPPSVVLADADSPAALRSRFDLVCERVMQLGQRPRILRLDDYRTVLDRAAEAAEPLLCGGGPLARLALIPPRLAAAYAPAGHEVLEGREEEAVFVALHAGASLRFLSTGEGDIAL